MQAEVPELMVRAEAEDQADAPDGLSFPKELAPTSWPGASSAWRGSPARAIVEARGKERHAREQGPGWRHARPGQRPPARSPAEIRPRRRWPGLPPDQVNLTDEESRIMPVPGGGFEQCYNVQAAVAVGSLLVVATDVVQAPNDKQQVEPMLGRLGALPAELGKTATLLADTGYFNAANVRWRRS